MPLPTTIGVLTKADTGYFYALSGCISALLFWLGVRK